MNRFSVYKNRIISGGVTLFVGIFSVLTIIFYDWTSPASPVFVTQAIDCTQGFLCDRDNVCDSPCETADTCPVDCNICGNSVCEPSENNANCSADCPNVANCGNRYCETGEDYLSCASDCALCERQSQEFIYQAGCSDHNIQNGYNIDLGNICACGSSCPIGMTGNFSCPYVGLFVNTEDGSCDNGIDDDNDGIVDCADTDCASDLICLGGSNGGLSLIQVRDSDDVNAPVSTLADALGSKEYLVVGYVETQCGPCQTFGANLNANTALQDIFSQGPCEFITITDPSIYNGIFSSWIDVVGAGSFVGKKSKELVSRDRFMSTYAPTGSPQAFLIDADGAMISSNIIGNNNGAGLTFTQDFYTICDGGGTTNGGSTTGGPSGSDNNGDGIPDSEQTDYVQTIASNNSSTTTLTATGTAVVITDLSLHSDGLLSSGSWYPAGGIDFSLTLPASESATISLLFANVVYQSDFLVYKHNGATRDVINGATIQQQGNDVLVTYTLTDNGTLDTNPAAGVIDDPIALGCGDPDNNQVCGVQSSAEICTGGVDEDLDTLIDCADSDCTSSIVCGGSGGGTGSAEICTGGVDEDIDTFIDCADSTCFGTPTCCSNSIQDGNETGIDCGGSGCLACVTTGASCTDGLLNGSETDIDCGGNCFKCINGKRCTLNADCTSANCAYGVLGASSTYDELRMLQDSPAVLTPPQVSLAGANEADYYTDRLFIKFKKENSLLLPTYADDMLLNSEQRYLGYLVGKVTALYEQQGIAPLMMVRAVDQLFDQEVNRIDHVFSLAATTAAQEDLANIYRVTFDPGTDIDALAAQLKTNLAIEYIEKEPIYKVLYSDPQAPQQWYLAKTEADKARDAGASGNATVVVAVIDNGFDLSHPDIQGALVQGRDVANNDNDPSLPSTWLTHPFGGHGTHTMGIAGAVTNNSLGVASVGGGIRIMPIKATYDTADPEEVSVALTALQYAIDQPSVKVISMSFGGGYSSTLESLINAHPEKIFVAAAGNNNVTTPQYPAAYSAVVSVAASDSNDQKASFSNYGSRVDIVAPGTAILSTLPSGAYGLQQGTSMSTPMVASALGLLLSLGDTNPVNTLKISADAMSTSAPFLQGNLGAGRMNICKAVRALGIACVSTNDGGLGQGICLAAGSTGTGGTTGQTGTGSTGTGGSTTTGSTSTGQQYPSGTIEIRTSNTRPINGDVVQWTLDWSYTSHAPQYPAATLDLLVDLPAGVVFMSGSYSLLGDGSFQGYDIDNGDPVFVIKMTGTPTTTTTTTRTYEGTIIFKTTITSTASSLSTNVVAQILCYGIPVQQYTGSPTCSTSQNRQSGIETSQDTQRIIINLSSTTTTAGSTSAGTTTNNGGTIGTGVVCGNGILQGTEECDDGNRLTNDGCSASCNIEQGRRCLPTSPSQCGSYDCFTHGESFLETNIFGTCCGGLQELIVVPTSAVVTGVVKSYICYDPLIGQPVCDTRASPSGRRIPTTTASGSQLVLKDSCRAIYKDYYKDLVSQLQGPHTQCVFADIPYDQVNFGDIGSTKQKVAIETLRDACVVQGIGEDLDTYGPGRPIQRAELIKMVVKLLIIADGSSSTESIGVYSGGIQFFDVPPTFWGAWYIDEAVRRGLLSAWTNQGLITFFKPHASVTREEFISLVRRIDFGQLLSREEIETIIGKRATVTRAAAAEVLVKKFLAILQPYFYFQGDQEEYYWRLTEELRGKNYQEQYSIILGQIDKLEQQDEHGSPEGRDTNDLNPFWMQEFLRDVIY